VGTGKVERKINVRSNMYAFLALISIALLAIFPIGIDIGAALIATEVVTSSISATTLATVGGGFFGGAAAFGVLSNDAYNQGNTWMASLLLWVGVGLAITGVGFE